MLSWLVLPVRPAAAVIPAVIGPAQALLALLPHLLTLGGALLVALVRPRTYRTAARWAWAHRGLVVGLAAAGYGLSLGLAAWTAGPLPPPRPGYPWTAAGGGPDRLGALPGATGPRQAPTLRWNRVGRPGESVDATPAIVGNRVYYPTYVLPALGRGTGTIACRDTDTGALVWELDGADLPGGRFLPIYSSPALGGEWARTPDGLVLPRYLVVGEGFHDDLGRLTCYDLAPTYEAPGTGRPRLHWIIQALCHIESSPCIFAGHVFVGAGDDGLWAVELATGRVAWRHEGIPSYRLLASRHDDRLRTLVGQEVRVTGTVAVHDQSEEAPGLVTIAPERVEVAGQEEALGPDEGRESRENRDHGKDHDRKPDLGPRGQPRPNPAPAAPDPAGDRFGNRATRPLPEPGSSVTTATPDHLPPPGGQPTEPAMAGNQGVDRASHRLPESGSGIPHAAPRPPALSPPSLDQGNGFRRTVCGRLAVETPAEVASRPTGRGVVTSGVQVLVGADALDVESSPAGAWLPGPASRPVVIYGCGNGGNAIVAADALSGAVVWRAPTPFPAFGSPVVAGDRVVLGLGNGTLLKSDRDPGGLVRCLSLTDGRTLWEFPTGDAVMGATPVADGLVFAASRDGRLSVLRLADGRLVRTMTAGAPMVCSPCLTAETVLATTNLGTVLAWDRATGRRRWSFPLTAGRPCFSSVVADGRRAYVGGDRRGLSCLEEGNPAANPAGDDPPPRPDTAGRAGILDEDLAAWAGKAPGLRWTALPPPGFRPLPWIGVPPPLTGDSCVASAGQPGSRLVVGGRQEAPTDGETEPAGDRRAMTGPRGSFPREAAAGEATGGAVLACLDADTGRILWQRGTGGRLLDAAVDAERVFALLTDDGTLAVRETGVPPRLSRRQGGSPSDGGSVGPLAMRETRVSRHHPWQQGGSPSDGGSVGSPPGTPLSPTREGGHPSRLLPGEQTSSNGGLSTTTATSLGLLAAFALADGQPLWERPLSLAASSSLGLTAGGDVAVAGVGAGDHLTAFEPRFGERRWEVDLGAHPAGPLAVGHDLLVVPTADRLLGCDDADGTIVWEAPLATPPVGWLAFGPDGVYLTWRDPWGATCLECRRLTAEPADPDAPGTGRDGHRPTRRPAGSTAWVKTVAGMPLGGPVVTHDAVVVQTTAGKVWAFSPADGSDLMDHGQPVPTGRGAPAAGGGLVFAAGKGEFAAVNLIAEAAAWRLSHPPAGGSLGQPVLAGNRLHAWDAALGLVTLAPTAVEADTGPPAASP